MSGQLTVAVLQCALGADLTTNVDRVAGLTREAAAAGARIVLPSELFEGPYFCREERDTFFESARPAAGHPTITKFQQLAKELNVVIPVSFFEKSGISSRRRDATRRWVRSTCIRTWRSFPPTAKTWSAAAGT